MGSKFTKRELRRVYSRQRVRQVCYHEAGHAVAAVLLGLGLKWKVKIRTHDKGIRGFGGREIWPGVVQTERRSTQEVEAIFLTAGWTAERFFDPRTQGYDYLRYDQQSFMDLMRVPADEYVILWQQYCGGATRAFVEQNWPCIRAVAQGLIRQKSHTLCRKRIIGLIERALLPK